MISILEIMKKHLLKPVTKEKYFYLTVISEILVYFTILYVYWGITRQTVLSYLPSEIPTIIIDCPSEQQSFLKAVCDDIYTKSGEKFIPSTSPIGTGGEGEVFLLKGNTDCLCLKVCHTNLKSPQTLREHSIYYQMTGMNFEKNFLKQIRHSKTPNLNFPVAGYKSPNFYGTVTKYNNMGTIQNFINKKIKLNEKYISSIIYDILNGLEFLNHPPTNIKLVGYDISETNIMLHNNGQRIETFLIDPGGGGAVSNINRIPENNDENLEIFVVGQILCALIYGERLDYQIYSSGGKLIYETPDLQYFLSNIAKDNNLSENCKDLLSKLLNITPESEIFIKDILNHEFFKSKENIPPEVLCIPEKLQKHNI